MLKIFISHNFAGKDDREVAEAIEQQLRPRYKKNIWRAKSDLYEGQKWLPTIEKEIKDCDVMIVVWSEISSESVVDTERQIAFSYGKEILPCPLHSAELPGELKTRQAISFDDIDHGVPILRKVLENLEDELEDDFPKFVPIPAGKFRYSIVKKNVNVKAFELSDFLITRRQFLRCGIILDRNARSYDRDQPINNVSWDQAVEYCKWLSIKINSHIKLPSQIQWEFAAKARHELEYATRDGKIQEGYCNYNNYEKKTTSKGECVNLLEVYDMSGNLWEWCEDEDPVLKDYRIVRGGSWIDPPENCRTTSRHSFHRSHGNLYTGFRVIRVLN